MFGAAPATVKVPLTAGGFVLHIEDLRLPPHSSGVVRVFADLPEANASTPTEDDHFVGYFTIPARNSRQAAEGLRQHKTRLDLSHKQKLLSGKKEISLTLVPVAKPATGNMAANDAKPTFSRVYLAKE